MEIKKVISIGQHHVSDKENKVAPRPHQSEELGHRRRSNKKRKKKRTLTPPLTVSDENVLFCAELKRVSDQTQSLVTHFSKNLQIYS